MGDSRRSAMRRVALGSVAVGALLAAIPVAGFAQSPAAAPAYDFSGVHVALVTGGAHPYFQPWKVGGPQAATDFGIGSTAFDESGQWDQTKETAAINAMAAQGANAFGIFGVSPTDINTVYEQLKGSGFAVGSLASCPAGDVDKADFCLSTDTQQAAYLAAQGAIQAMGGKGNLVHLTGNAVDSNTQRRMAGVQQAVDETNGAVTLLTTVTDIDSDLQTAQKAVSDLLAAQGDKINGIVTTAYNPAVAATDGVKTSGLPIAVIAIDDDPTVLQAITDGIIAGTVVQNPWGQAYVGSWVLAALQSGNCTMNTPGQYVDSGSFLVTKDNVTSYDAQRQATSMDILKDFQTKYLTCKAA
ncbi:MAG: sugar ABC transporter substrate-binding protein [Chloroflexota bacterium]